jgi:hypothetical protein
MNKWQKQLESKYCYACSSIQRLVL